MNEKQIIVDSFDEQEYEVFNFVDTTMCGDCRKCKQSAKCEFGTHLLATTYQIGGA